MASQPADIFRAVNTAFQAEQPAPEEQKRTEKFYESDWQGPVPGYVFKKGKKGIGYYLDDPGAEESDVDEPTGQAGPSVGAKDAQELLQVRY